MSAGAKPLKYSTPQLPRRVGRKFHPKTRSSSFEYVCPTTRHAIKASRYLFNEDVDEIGRGKYGVVYRAKDMAKKRIVAVKVLSSANIFLRREVSTMMCLQHENILRMLDTYLTGALYIVYDFISNGDLFHWTVSKYGKVRGDIRPVISSRTMTRIARQTGKALAYCHGQGIAHRDFKPENVLVRVLEPDIELSVMDFGLSFGIATSEALKRTTDERAGSMEYAAPEVLFGKADVDPYATDVWSYGVSLYTIAHHAFPWAPLSELRFLDARDMPGSVTDEVEPHVGDGLRNIINQALRVQPNDRPSMEYLAGDDRIEDDEANDASSMLEDPNASSYGEADYRTVPSFAPSLSWSSCSMVEVLFDGSSEIDSLSENSGTN